MKTLLLAIALVGAIATVALEDARAQNDYWVSDTDPHCNIVLDEDERDGDLSGRLDCVVPMYRDPIQASEPVFANLTFIQRCGADRIKGWRLTGYPEGVRVHTVANGGWRAQGTIGEKVLHHNAQRVYRHPDPAIAPEFDCANPQHILRWNFNYDIWATDTRTGNKVKTASGHNDDQSITFHPPCKRPSNFGRTVQPSLVDVQYNDCRLARLEAGGSNAPRPTSPAPTQTQPPPDPPTQPAATAVGCDLQCIIELQAERDRFERERDEARGLLATANANLVDANRRVRELEGQLAAVPTAVEVRVSWLGGRWWLYSLDGGQWQQHGSYVYLDCELGNPRTDCPTISVPTGKEE